MERRNRKGKEKKIVNTIIGKVDPGPNDTIFGKVDLNALFDGSNATVDICVGIAYMILWVLFHALWLVVMGFGFWQFCKRIVSLGSK